MALARALVAAALLVPLAPAGLPAQAAPAWQDGPDGEGGYEVYYGDAGEDEFLPFIAACDRPGLPVRVWYFHDRARFAGQGLDARGLRQTLEPVSATLLVDGRRFTFADARAEPEATYDGNEILLLLKADDALFHALARGAQVSLEVEGAETGALPLDGSFQAFTRLVAFCRGL
jgi:hypothetical protein